MHRLPPDIPALRWSFDAHQLGSFLVVIHDLYVVCSIRFPAETDAKLIIDSDTVLTSAISRKRFQMIARRNS
jgi:hypothetical protein